MTSAAGLALELAVSCASLVALAAFGRRLRRLARVPAAGAVGFAADLVLGAWAVAAAVLLLGLVGALSPWLAAVPVAAACAGRWRGLLAGWRRSLPGALAALPLLPVALGRPFFYDALVYHLGLPWQSLQEGRIAAHGENLFSAFPPLAQLLYLPALAAGGERVPGALHLLTWIAASAAVVSLARRLGARPPLAGLAGAAVVLLPTHALVPAFPAAEGWALAAVVAAVAVAVGPPRPGTPLLAGVLAGVAAASRLQGVAWAVIVLPLAAWRSRRRLRVLIGATAGCAAAAAVWWGKNLVLLGRPLAPIGWSREGIETLYRDGASALHLAGSLRDGVTIVASHLAGSWPYLLLLGLAAAPAVVREPRSRPLAVATVAGLLAWSATGALPRFLAPTVALLLALAACGRRSRPARLAALLALGASLLWGAAANLDLLIRIGAASRPLAASPGGADEVIVNDPRPAFRACANLPAASRLLLVGEPRPFGLPRPCLVTSQHDVSPLRALLEAAGPDRAVRALCDAGVSHVLVNWNELRRLAPGYPVLPYATSEGATRFRSLLDGCGVPIVSPGGVEVFTLPCGSLR